MRIMFKKKFNGKTKDSFKLITKDITSYIESFQFNKSVAKIYEFINILTDNLNKKHIQKEFEMVLGKGLLFYCNHLSLILAKRYGQN